MSKASHRTEHRASGPLPLGIKARERHDQSRLLFDKLEKLPWCVSRGIGHLEKREGRSVGLASQPTPSSPASNSPSMFPLMTQRRNEEERERGPQRAYGTSRSVGWAGLFKVTALHKAPSGEHLRLFTAIASDKQRAPVKSIVELDVQNKPCDITQAVVPH